MSESIPRYTSKAEGFRTADEIAAMRPMASPRPRGPRKAASLTPRQVTSGIVCFCGERFTESQSLEFMLHLRAEVGEILDWAGREREKAHMYARRYRSKPEVRERIRAYGRERSRQLWKDPRYRSRERERKSDPEYREGRRQYSRERYKNPEYREQDQARKKSARYRERDREYQRERMKDPEVRERKNAVARERYARKRAEREAAGFAPAEGKVPGSE